MSTHQIIRFMSDDHRLTGTLHLPDSPNPPVVIGCHGLLADRHSPKQVALADGLGRIQIAYFRFDHRGCGDSQGAITADGLLHSRCQDLHDAIRAMEEHPAVGPLAGLFGSSFGGTVVMATAARRPVPCLVTNAAPISSDAIEASATRKMHSHLQKSLAALEGLHFDIRSSLNALRNILIIHGERDEIVPIDHARDIHDHAGQPKKLIIQKAGDHRMSHPQHQEAFIDACTSWFQRVAPRHLQSTPRK